MRRSLDSFHSLGMTNLLDRRDDVTAQTWKCGGRGNAPPQQIENYLHSLINRFTTDSLWVELMAGSRIRSVMSYSSTNRDIFIL